MFPRTVSESVSSELHNIFEITYGELVFHVILIQCIKEGIFEPAGSFFHVIGDFLEEQTFGYEFGNLGVWKLGNIIFVIYVFSHDVVVLCFGLDLVGKHAKLLRQNYSHKGGTKL
jgi:hypothetical protein